MARHWKGVLDTVCTISLSENLGYMLQSSCLETHAKDFPLGRHTTPPSESNRMYIGKKSEPLLCWIYFSRGGWVILILHVLDSDFNPAWSAYM